MGVIVVSHAPTFTVTYVLALSVHWLGGSHAAHGVKGVTTYFPVNGKSLGNACGIAKPQGESLRHYSWGA
jgi:hypothetical protein